MKKILFFLFLSSQIFTQNKEMLIEYDVYYNTSSPRIRTSYLAIFNSNKSQFIEMPNYRLINKEKKDEINDGETITFEQNGIKKEIKIDFITKKLYSIERLFLNKTIFKVSEDLPKFNWDVTFKETKRIGNYDCSKAETYFRGRRYTIWYAKDIPIRFGPWKFHSTPGLILEAYDESSTYKWVVVKISKIDDDFKKFASNVDFDKELTIKDFTKKKYGKREDIDIFDKSLQSKLPRGTSLKINRNLKRQGRELIYEWEE